MEWATTAKLQNNNIIIRMVLLAIEGFTPILWHHLYVELQVSFNRIKVVIFCRWAHQAIWYNNKTKCSILD